jgi:hypothetical protein
MDELEKVIKKSSAKSKIHRRDDSNSDSKLVIGLGSIGKIEIKLEETVEKTKFTPPSLIIAIPTIIASNQDDVCPMPFSNAGDVMLTSSSKTRRYMIVTVLLLLKTHLKVKPQQ